MVHVNMEIETEALVEKYLGLPTAIGKSSDVQFEHIATNIRKLVNGYVPKLLSSAAREVLIKAVCQAIPTYSMSCFRLSKKLCKKLTNIVARFFWGEMIIRGNCIGRSGRILQYLKEKEGWVLGISNYSTRLCWRNKAGGCLHHQIVYALES